MMESTRSPYRDPPEESVDLYPGLVVADDRQTGSITAGRSGLPLWAFVGSAINDGWETVHTNWEPERYGWTKEDMIHFLFYLLDLRGEFARFLLVLADAERIEETHSLKSWWQTKRQRQRVAAQLRRCLAILEKPL